MQIKKHLPHLAIASLIYLLSGGLALSQGEAGSANTPDSAPAALGAEGYSHIAIGAYHSCAVSQGELYCWGVNEYGQLGDGTTNSHFKPVKVLGLAAGVIGVAVGSHHSCAITAEGAARCWGYNFSGQLGDGSEELRLEAVPVVGLNSGVASLSAGAQHTCAVMATGEAQCWGNNSYGQLGDGSGVSRRTPVIVQNLGENVASLALGQYHTCAVTKTKELNCWGYNFYGQVGDGSDDSRPYPVTVDIAAPVQSATCGALHTCAVTTGGELFCWGDNAWGQLGLSGEDKVSTPRPIPGLRSVSSAVAEGQRTCVVVGASTKCWGETPFSFR